MQYPKPTKLSKVEADANWKYVKGLPCEVCAVSPVEVHHWVTKGAGGQDTLENLHPLCTKHHREFHQLGVKTFWKRYGKAINWFREKKKLPLVSN